MRLLEKQYYILQKYHSDGRVIEQIGKSLQVNDKYITIVFKGYFF